LTDPPAQPDRPDPGEPSPPAETAEERALRLAKPKDLILGLIVGVIGAWTFHNQYGYDQLPDGSFEINPLRSLISIGLPLLIGTGLVYWLLRRRRKSRLLPQPPKTTEPG